MVDHIIRFFGKKDSWAVGVVFAFNSFLFGNWVTRIPDVKLALNLSEADLGLALMTAPIGSIIITPLAGILIQKIGVGKSTLISLLLFIGVSVFPPLSNNFLQFCLVLFFFGAFGSFLDIAMNAAAAVTERKLKYPIMITCHGMWSLGTMIGAFVGSIFVGLQISASTHMAFFALLTFIGALFLSRHILTYKDDVESSHALVWPNRAILGLAAIGFCVYLGEGAIADWSAIYMKETLESNPYLTGLAFSGFSLTMAIGRFFGDAIIPRFGKRRVVELGGLVASIGLAIALIPGIPLLAIIGFSITGLGFSCIVPSVMSSSANIPGISTGSGLAIVATLGFTGFLAGPPLIGFIAEFTSLQWSLGIIGFLSLLIFAGARRTSL